MNGFSIIGVFVLLIFANCAPPRGPDIDVVDVTFENRETFNTHAYPGSVTCRLKLVKLLNGTFEIEETVNRNDGPMTFGVARFGIEGLDTMLSKVVVARTDDNSYFQMETLTPRDAQRLFNMTTRRKLGERLYSYKLSAVYQYQQGRILEDKHISGFTYETAGSLQQRYIIHSGLPTELIPHLLWTEDSFYYSSYGDKSILLALVKPASSSYEYFLVEFVDKPTLERWTTTPGKRYSRNIPLPSTEIVRYFRPYIAP